MKPPPMGADARARTFAEARIVDYLLLCGWARDAHRGDCGGARGEVRAALDRSTALGLPYARAADGSRLYDPAEVVNFLKWAGVRHRDAFWRDHYVPQGRALVRAFHGAGTATGVPPPPATLGPRRFDVELEREFALARVQSRSRTMLRVPAPIEDGMLCDLAVECSGPPGIDVDFAVAPGRADARFAAPDSAAIGLKVCASFTALPGLPDPRATPLSPADVDLYTRPAEGLVRVSPRVHALAEHLAGAARDPWQVVRSFWSFVGDSLTWGVVDYTRLDAAQPLDHVLESGWFDCQLGSALLAALCRSRGIPARVVSGYTLYPDSPSYHWWAEVALADRGWVPLDTNAFGLSGHEGDPAWRDYFCGQVDYRMKCESLPRIFNRSPGFRLPDAWRVLPRAVGEATEIGMYACDTGEPAYRDRIVVRERAEAGGGHADAGDAARSSKASPL